MSTPSSSQPLYTCGLCNFTTESPAAMAAHQLDVHGYLLPVPTVRDGHLVSPVDLLADHLTHLLAERKAKNEDPAG